MQVYHGTLSKNLLSIQRNGLRNDSSSNEKIHGYDTNGQISFSTNYNDAFYYASLFANKSPISILLVELNNDIEIFKGAAHSEIIVKKSIPNTFIRGAFLNEKMIPLKQLKTNINYINYELLTGMDKKVALKYYINENKNKEKNNMSKLREMVKRIIREETSSNKTLYKVEFKPEFLNSKDESQSPVFTKMSMTERSKIANYAAVKQIGGFGNRSFNDLGIRDTHKSGQMEFPELLALTKSLQRVTIKR